jgi:predicted transcriptional regulator YheO
MARILNQLLNEELKLSRDILEKLYKRNVCEEICDEALKLLPDNVLKSSIAVSLYNQNISKDYLTRSEIIEQISRALKMGRNTVLRHVPKGKSYNVIKINRN